MKITAYSGRQWRHLLGMTFLPLLIVAADAARPGTADAQAICSGPHAGPGRPTSGGLTTAAPGDGWLQATFFHHGADSYYDSSGEARAFGANGHVQTRSLYLTGAVGIVHGADVMAQLPIHDLEFSTTAGSRGRTGIGDPRLYLRVDPQLFGVWGVPIALRGGVKLVGAEFPVDSQIIPITEGQRDWELMFEAGHAMTALPLYVRGWVGYRWREANEVTSQAPGNERFAYLALGGPAGPVGWEVAIEGLSGETPRQLGFEVPSGRRTLVQVYPAIAMVAGPGQIEFGGRIPLEGSNFPTGAAGSIGYSWRWGAF
ncbi:MAG: hypothetical protein WD766_12415 [Gemmatimonadota bacterium]